MRIPPFPPRSLSPAAKSLMCRVGEHGVELTADHQIKPFAPHRSSPESPTVPFAPLPLHPAEECFGASSAPNEAFGFRRFPDAFWGDEANTSHPLSSESDHLRKEPNGALDNHKPVVFLPQGVQAIPGTNTWANPEAILSTVRVPLQIRAIFPTNAGHPKKPAASRAP